MSVMTPDLFIAADHPRVEWKPARSAVAPVRITPRMIQVGLGLLWVLDGLLQLQPSMFGHAFVTGTLAPAASGQPAILGWPITHVADLVSVSPASFNFVFASLQLLIGIGVLRRATTRPALALSIVWAAGVWAFGEGFGMLLTPQASPLTGAPGAVLLYALLAVVAWPRSDAPASGGSAAAEGLLGERWALGVWALVWAGMGLLWLLPQNMSAGSISSQVMSAPAGDTAVVAHLQAIVAHAFRGIGTQTSIVLAVVSFMIAIGTLWIPRGRVMFLVLGVALSLDFWVLGQSLGGLLSGTGTDPNIGPLLALFALALFPNATPEPTAPISWESGRR